MKVRRKRSFDSHMIGDLFTFALFGVFLLLSLLIVVIGVEGYRSVVSVGESVGGVRTSLGYISGKVRSNAARDGVHMEQHDGVDTLVLTENISGKPYLTVIYHKDGMLYELYTSADGYEFYPEDGEPLIEIADLHMACLQDDLLQLSTETEDGRAQTLHLHMRAGQGRSD